jgi:TP901 family phage tail tape measure protein
MGSPNVEIKIKIETAAAAAKLQAVADKARILSEKAEQASVKTKLMEQRLKSAASSGGLFSQRLGVANIALASFIGNLTSRAVTAGFNALKNGIVSIVSIGKDFEEVLITIGKTTGLSGSKLDELGQEIVKISQKIPIATQDLAELAVVAGQLGIQGTAEIAKFTEIMGKLTLATDIAGEEGAQDVARILTITGELEKNGTQNIEKFGSVITELGNNFAATESQILSVAKQVSKGTAPFKLASEDVLAIGTAFKATGSEAASAGTAIQKTFSLIGTAVEKGGDSLTKFANAAGLSNEAFTELFRSDPTKAFEQLTTNLGKTSKTGGELSVILQSLGLGSDRVKKSLSPLITNYQVLSSAISQARKEAVTKNALDEETAAAQNSLASDITKLSNAWDKMAIQLFQELGPALRSIIQSTTEFVTFVTSNQSAVVGAFTAIGTAAAVMWLGITGPVGIAVLALGSLAFALGLVGDSIRDADAASAQYRQTQEELHDGYNEADTDTKRFVDGYSDILDVTNEAANNLVELDKGLDEHRKNLVETGDATDTFAKKTKEAAVAVALFEKDKVKDLKKFYKEDEVAKLESNFAKTKSDKEREAFLNFVSSEGKRRQSDQLKAILGLDKATLDAARKKQEELKKLADLQKTREDELAEAKQNVRLQEEQDFLLQFNKEQVFRDERLLAVQESFTLEEQAAIQAKINLTANETEKQTLITQAFADGIQKRGELAKKSTDEEIKLKKSAAKNVEAIARNNTRAEIGFAATAANSILKIAGASGKAILLLNKAFAVADIIIRGQQAEAVALATFGPFAAPAIAGIKTQTALQVATVAAATIGELAAPSFQNGGIVGGNSFSGDNVAANVNSGEMILNRQQQSQLFNMANNGGTSKAQEIVVHTTVELDGEAIGNSVSRQVANGLELGEVQ